MDSAHSPAPQAPVKKVLVKKVKVLVKRPVSAPAGAAPAPAPRPGMVKVPVKRPVQPQPAAPAAPRPAPAQAHQIPAAPAQAQPPARQPAPPPPPVPARPVSTSYVGQVVNGVLVKPIKFEIPDDILEALERREKIPDKLFLLYIYARLLAEHNAEEEGYEFPDMMIELPKDTLEAAKLIDEIDEDIFDAILDDFTEMAMFIPGMERIMGSSAPLDKLIQMELARIQNQDEITRAHQIILGYLMILADMQMIQQKLEMKEIKDEEEDVINEIREIEDDEKEMKQDFIKAIQRKNFPVDAERLVNNYFNLAKKDSEKAYNTLITNPLFFSPIQMEKMPRKFFGLVKSGPKDAIAVNKRLASFLKNLKV